MAYIGQAPTTLFRRAPIKDSFTGDASTVAFDLANIVPAGGENALQVFVDNVRQEPGSGKAYTLGVDGSGDLNRITFSAAPASSAAIYVLTNFSNEAFSNLDLNGSELQIDADGDTTITADSDDTIDIKVSGADDFQITANTLTALSGSSLATNTIAETTSGTGVTIDGVLLKDSLVASTAVSAARRPNVKPLLINGSMDISQRGTSFTSNGYTLDRWTMDESSDAAVTVTQDTDVPSGSGFAKSLKVDVTTADASIAAAQYCGFTQYFEGQNLQLLKYGTSSAENLTLSFWVKAVKTGTYCIRFVKEAGSGTRYETPIEYTISSGSTWEKKVINLSPTAGSTSLITGAAAAIVNTNAAGYRIMFTLAAGTDYHGTNNTWVAGSNKMGTSSQVNGLDSTSNNFWVTGVQLEIGEYSSTNIPPFQHESYGDNLHRCARYYWYTGGGAAYQFHGTGVEVSSTAAYINVPLINSLRTAPTFTLESSLVVFDGNGESAITSLGNVYYSSHGSLVNIACNASGGGLSDNAGAVVYSNNDSTSGFQISAEL